MSLYDVKVNSPDVLMYKCDYCSFAAYRRNDTRTHTNQHHPEIRTCHECGKLFETTHLVNEHAVSEHHSAYACPEKGCRELFTRDDVLRRHLNSTHRKEKGKFTCHFCVDNSKSFGRKDHLQQHMRIFHRIGNLKKRSTARWCPHEDCPYSADQAQQNSTDDSTLCFKSSRDYACHMREVHKESLYFCQERGCGLRGKGYLRERDLARHMQRDHGHKSSPK